MRLIGDPAVTQAHKRQAFEKRSFSPGAKPAGRRKTRPFPPDRLAELERFADDGIDTVDGADDRPGWAK
jgi:hypothetical protein